jgi:tRNA dimethylallyltransferase
MNASSPAIFLMGPTASGKTTLAVELAKRLPLELVSVDSALVYRGMDIGTAKPDAETRARAPHHLIDIIEPTESYSVAQFREDALQRMEEITRRGNVPLLVGGTMLYFNVLQHGLDELPPADDEIRAQIEVWARREGWPALHAELARVDPETAGRLQPTDAQRIARALEIWQLTSRPMSELLQRNTSSLPYRLLKIALLPSDRSVLHQRIAKRFDLMLHQGLIEELEALRQRYPRLAPAFPSMRCVGYRQAWQYLEGEYDLSTLRDKGIAATRQLAKRQLTWLRGMHDVIELDCLAPDLQQQVHNVISCFIYATEG